MCGIGEATQGIDDGSNQRAFDQVPKEIERILPQRAEERRELQPLFLQDEEDGVSQVPDNVSSWDSPSCVP